MVDSTFIGIDSAILAMDAFQLLMVTLAFFMVTPVYRRDKKSEYMYLLAGLAILFVNYLIRFWLGYSFEYSMTLGLPIVNLMTSFFEAVGLVLLMYFFTISIFTDKRSPFQWGRVILLTVIGLTGLFIILQQFELIQDMSSVGIFGGPVFNTLILVVIISALTQLFKGHPRPFWAIAAFISIGIAHLYGLFYYEDARETSLVKLIYPWPFLFNSFGYFFLVAAVYSKITIDQLQLFNQLKKRGRELEAATSNLSRLNRLSTNLLKTTELKGIIRMILDSLYIELGFKNAALFILERESESLRGYKISSLTGAPVSYPQISLLKKNFLVDSFMKAQSLLFGQGHITPDAAFIRDYDFSANFSIIPLLTKKEHECHEIYSCDVKNCPVRSWDLSICWLMQNEQCPCGKYTREEKIRNCLRCPAFNLVGMIILDNRNARLKVTESNIKFLETFANQAGMALQSAFLVEDLSRESTLRTETLKNLPVGVIVLDTDGKIREFNDAACEIVCIEKESVYGKHYTEIKIVDRSKTIHSQIQEILDGMSTGREGEIYDNTLTIAGTVKILNVHLRPILKNLRLNGLIIMIEDMTSMKELERQLIRSESLASMGQFAMGIAHEINNPLAGVSGVLQVLESRFEKDSSERKALSTARKDLNRASNIIKDLLKFAKQKPPDKKLMDLNHQIEESIDFIPYQPGGENMTIIKDLDEKLPLISADQDQIQQVITNLILNAIVATSKNEGKEAIIEFSTWYDKNWVYLQVYDNGIGVDRENLKKIFEPFFTTKSFSKGTGLGLSLCDRIISDHGGLISVRSDAGVGTAFLIKLPRERL